MATGKEEKEAFVSGLTGSTLWEVYGVLLTSSCGLIVRHTGILCSKTIAKIHKENIIFAVLWDFVTVVLTSLLCFTILADYVPMVMVSLVFVILFTLLLKAKPSKPVSFSELLNSPYPKRSPQISTSRVWTNVFTVIAILAVDFNIFPRRFAKTETYGISLMDVGVGCFILCHGVVGPETRQSHPPQFNIKPYIYSVVHCIKTLSPCLVLGVVRLLTVKATDYQQHVTEYGVHWNFFFTIAAVKIFIVMIVPLVSLIPDIFYSRYMIFSGLIGLVYQTMLSYCGLSNYIILGPNGDNSRDNFISANREGIFSCTGYIALYYVGVHVGRYTYQRKTLGSMMRLNIALFMSVPCCIVLIMIMENSVEKVSRRMANVPYCLFIITVSFLTFNVMFICDFIVIYLTKSQSVTVAVSSLYLEKPSSKNSSDQTFSNGPAHLCIMACIDYNQFFFFLLANIYTGIVNVSFDTIKTGPVYSFIILVVYLLLLVVSIVVLGIYSIKLL